MLKDTEKRVEGIKLIIYENMELGKTWEETGKEFQRKWKKFGKDRWWILEETWEGTVYEGFWNKLGTISASSKIRFLKFVLPVLFQDLPRFPLIAFTVPRKILPSVSQLLKRCFSFQDPFI